MKKEEFFGELHSLLELKSVPALNEQTKLKELTEYDSMMILSMIAFVDQFFNKTLTAQQLNSVNELSGLMNLIGRENFE